MNRAILIRETGGPEVMALAEVAVAAAGPGEALIRQTAIGVNFKDVYERMGNYPLALPFVPGNEAAGIVEAVGPGVTVVGPGDRVAYANVVGAYAERRLIAADRLMKLPPAVDDRTAAAAMLKGMTAEYLLHRTYPVRKGQTILFHAAAGGVGLIACQWASALGVTVIGTVGSAEKAALAARNGCHHVINYRTEDVVARVREITGGSGVDVVYDSVGRDTFPASLDALKPRGMWVTFGQSSGPLPAIETQMLSRKGSLYMTRPTLMHYIADRADLEATAANLFTAIANGIVRVRIDREFPLADAAAAHRALEGRQTTGSVILLP